MHKNPIVIIEDDQDDCDLLVHAFEDLGIKNELKFFQNGLEALAYLKATDDRAFLILSDVNMPLMNGMDLKKTIYKDERLRKQTIPFVFFSTSSRPKEILQAYEMMVQGYFIKSNDFENLKALLKVIIDYWKVCRHPNSVN
jgi:CheY-like chemotaxis protein